MRFGKWLTVSLATTSIALSFLNWTLLTGREYGHFYGVFSDPPTYGFAAHGPNYYQSINIWYIKIILCFVAYLSMRYLGSTIHGLVIRVLALCVAVYPFFNMLFFKYGVLDITDRYAWLRNSVYLDWFCLTAIGFIIGFEIISVMRASNELTHLNALTTKSATKPD